MPPSDSRPLRIAYFGLPLGALLLLRDGHHLSLCVLSPVAAPGRRRLLARVPDLLETAKLGPEFSSRVASRLEAERPDLLVSWFWTRKLPGAWLSSARQGALGVHPSLLPRHRGPNPYFWAIDSGDELTGVSVHLLEEEYDRGAVLERETLVLGDKNAWQLARALDRPSLRALRRVVAGYARGEPPDPRPQEDALATPAPEPSDELLHADFHWPTERVLRRIRALSPVPGLALSLKDVDFFVLDATPASGYASALVPGEAQVTTERVLLRTADGAISIERAALAGPEDHGEPAFLSGDELANVFRELIDSGPLEVF